MNLCGVSASWGVGSVQLLGGCGRGTRNVSLSVWPHDLSSVTPLLTANDIGKRYQLSTAGAAKGLFPTAICSLLPAERMPRDCFLPAFLSIGYRVPPGHPETHSTLHTPTTLLLLPFARRVGGRWFSRDN
eukprot:scaffold90929_cov30-Tisochrysis_lutea.AAC.2